ncbi:hypothetical protein NVP1123O_58 [Vibrio phage 1.123.O._10N.286.48.F3]|nr:hypothetical protein NVP1123O_58 [Vibrio phage 1.123.O._10N.286.48.F3]
MATLTSAVLTKKYHKQVDSGTGVPAESVKIADVRGLFESYNQAANYLTENFIPAWDSGAGGTLPEVFDIEAWNDGKTARERILIQVVGGVASVYVP